MRALSLFAVIGLSACASQVSPAPKPDLPVKLPVAREDSRVAILPSSASRIGFERMSRFPDPGWQVPRNVAFSGDGKRVTFLLSESGSDEMALFAFDLATQKTAPLVRASDLEPAPPPTSREEELRNERQRKKTKGITDYVWATDSNVLVIPYGGDVFVRDDTGAITRITKTPSPEIDPKPCANGSRVAYVRDNDLYVYDRAEKRERRLTKGGTETRTHGLSDFNGQEELDEPSGFFWSPDCASIVSLTVDATRVREIELPGYKTPTPRESPDLRDVDSETFSKIRYPRAGRPNPEISVDVIDVKAGKVIATHATLDHYVARFRFSKTSAAVFLETATRGQKQCDVVKLPLTAGDSPLIGKVPVLLSHGGGLPWHDVRDLEIAPDGKEGVTIENRGGHDHLTWFTTEGAASSRAGTDGAWDVTGIEAVDDEAAFVMATKDETTGRQLYRVPRRGGAMTRLTPERGTHSITLSTKAGAYVDVHSALDRLPVAIVKKLDGTVLGSLPTPRDPDLEALGLTPAQPFSFEHAGVKLEGHLQSPRTVEPGKRYPLILMVYGGPGVQTVLDRWSPRPFWQHLADRGFFVAQVDNRGTAGRGSAFAAPIYQKLGEVELEDQLAALDHLVSTHPIDPARAGIYGHSYGGTMVLQAMLRATGRFAVGVSGSPVVDWGLYDTGYTERYMGTLPESNALYQKADLASHASKLEGDLLLIHALMDENVHFAHTARLIDAFVASGTMFDLMVFPNERHGYRSPAARRYAFEKVAEYFADHL